jgi:acetyl-CoA carboxylase carboxyl transferase subunit beta
MSILAWIEDQRKLKVLNAPKYNHPASDGSQGLWTRCDHCGVILYIKHLKENQRVCFGCGYHLQMNSQERMEHLIDPATWRPLDETLSPCDPLEFKDQKAYSERLRDAQERTGLQDAVQTGTGMLDGIPVALGIMDFHFMGGSMGSVVGEKITRLIEYATQEGLTLILICASGGARMQEGIFSLMQMAKISSALQIYQSCANLLYISVLTSPTTGGVTASFAMLGDLIFAEPKALIGFAGRRVIEQTLQEDLPEDFQTSEYLLHHGLLDLIVPRCFLKQALSETITLYKDAPFKRLGFIPHGVQNKMSFITEEKVRRQHKKLTSSMSSSKGQYTERNALPPANPMPSPSVTSKENELSPFLSLSQYIFPAIAPPNSDFKVENSPILQNLDKNNFDCKEKDEEIIQTTESRDQQISSPLSQSPERITTPFGYQYREILTSFQTMFALLSNLTEKNMTRESQESAMMLTSMIQTEKRRSFLANKQDKITQVITLASKESLEWRAFYIDQKLSQARNKWNTISALKSKISTIRDNNSCEDQEKKDNQKEFLYRAILQEEKSFFL